MLIDFEDASLGYSAWRSTSTVGRFHLWEVGPSGPRFERGLFHHPPAGHILITSSVVKQFDVSACAYSSRCVPYLIRRPFPCRSPWGLHTMELLTEAPQVLQAKRSTAGSGYSVNVYCDDQVRVTGRTRGMVGHILLELGRHGDAFVFRAGGPIELILGIHAGEMAHGISASRCTTIRHLPCTFVAP
jgi:hypothetical protein